MKDHKEFIKNFIAGLFFLGGILLLLFVILSLGKDKGLTQPKFQVVVHFKDVGGLMEGAPVRLAGVNVGTVSDVQFLPAEVNGYRVRVLINIFNKYESQLVHEAGFEIMTEGILGEKLIAITALDNEKLFNRDVPILGNDVIDVQDLAEVFSQAAKSFTKTSEDLNEVDYQEMSEVLAEAVESLMETSKGINRTLDEFRYVTHKTKRILDRVEQKLIDGNLFKVF